MPRRTVLGLAAVATALAFALPASAATNHIAHIPGFAYSPDPLVVQVGDSVQWVNDPPNADHTATVDPTPGNPFSFDTGNIAPSEISAPITMTTAGSYLVYCAIHGVSMTQQLIVEEVAPPPVVPESPGVPLLALGGAAALIVVLWWQHRRRLGELPSPGGPAPPP